MTRDRSPSRRTVHPDPYAGPDPNGPLPSPRALAIPAALSVSIVAVAFFPIAAAFALALLAGVVAGAALQRRYPSAIDRTLPDFDDETAAAGNR